MWVVAWDGNKNIRTLLKRVRIRDDGLTVQSLILNVELPFCMTYMPCSLTFMPESGPE